MKIRVAGLQMPVRSEIRRNADRICEAVERAARARAEILLTPEGSLSGYRPDFDVGEAADALERVTALARRLKVGLALGTCFVEADGECYNQIRFYRPSGEFLGFHSKTLLCAGLGRAASPQDEINHYAESRLRVFRWAPGLTIGGLICNDLWANPQCTPMPDIHLSQRLAAKGARIIFHAVNGGRDGSENSKLAWQYHEANLRMRAQAGNLWIVTADNSHPASLPCSAPSGVIDPHGRWVCRVKPKGPQFFVCTIDLAPGGTREKAPVPHRSR
jgi:predicted amidohydrolase